MKHTLLAASLASLLLLSACASEVPRADMSGPLPVERQPLPAGDGWGSAGPGVTGGSAAKAGDVYTVSTRKQFVDALKRSGNSPKILRIQGTINLSSDDSGRELGYKDYVDPAYDFEAYKKLVNPHVWNRQPLVNGRPPKITGALEEARLRSWNRQKHQVLVLIPSNTTLIGLGQDAKIIKGNLYLDRGVSNIIIRNIGFEDAYDYFPAWNPGDSYSTTRTAPVIDDFGVNHTVPGCQAQFVDEEHGPHRCNGGRWNSEFDLISIKGATQVWIDHCSFSDGQTLAKTIPNIFALPYDQPEQKITPHDGLLDITNASNFVTVSNSHFFNHDKSMLVGGSDNAPGDEGYLKVTYHHNFFDGLRQRQQLVRYGQVHSYNNLFAGSKTDPQYPFAYAFGLGAAAKIHSENNVFEIAGLSDPAGLVSFFVPGAALRDVGSVLNGKPVGIVQSFNAAGPKAAIADITWTPPRPADLLAPDAVPAYVRANAGAGKL
ncbi:PbsX family transcriptional regulator [Uliginosibacterium sp. 31-16]|uniref:pectate lyase family protein n=1 Tax=Uliginosibacterium sp. 31-16 TaxID=3068315 RepID=UPI00273EC07E|nr:PbsX family transcriptional regulator [Uliginosibacterium sp. 31-16]MDP5240098.1 PbsX family transcriptional regulator [Uliginosibacterium sp. 31-16]